MRESDIHEVSVGSAHYRGPFPPIGPGRPWRITKCETRGSWKTHGRYATEAEARAAMKDIDSCANPPSPAAGLWRTDLPDDEILVLVRTDDAEYPLATAHHSDHEWRSQRGAILGAGVCGWMHLEDAARILDAAKE